MLTKMVIMIWVVLSMVSTAHKNDVGYSPALKKENEVKASFKKLNCLVGKLDETWDLSLYEGLPHPVWKGAELGLELKKGTSMRRFDFAFYKKPNPLHEKDMKSLRATVKHPRAMQRFIGYKGCGGFHPDFALVFKKADNVMEFHICFGCNVVKVFYNPGNLAKRVEVYCDMTEVGKNTFEFLLKHYKKQSPQ